MEDGAWLCVRPSGTEPKVKFYYGVKGTSLDDAKEKSEALGASVTTIKRDLYVLRDLNLIKYVGSNKTGHWEVIN